MQVSVFLVLVSIIIVVPEPLESRNALPDTQTQPSVWNKQQVNQDPVVQVEQTVTTGK